MTLAPPLPFTAPRWPLIRWKRRDNGGKGAKGRKANSFWLRLAELDLVACACVECLGIAGEVDLGAIVRTTMVDVAAAVVKYRDGELRVREAGVVDAQKEAREVRGQLGWRLLRAVEGRMWVLEPVRFAWKKGA